VYIYRTCRYSSVELCRRHSEANAICSTHDTRSRNRHHKSTPFFSGAGFWYVCRANLGPDSSGIRFWRQLEQVLFYSKPETVMCTRIRNTAQKSVINTIQKLKFLLSLQCSAKHWTEFKISLMCLFSLTEIFIPDTYGRKNSKIAPENGVGL